MQKSFLLLTFIFLLFIQCRKEENSIKNITLKGKVIDKKSKIGLSKVVVMASDSAPCTGGFGSLGTTQGSSNNLTVTTDDKGVFQLSLPINKNLNTIQWYILPEKEYYYYSKSACDRYEVGLNFDEKQEVNLELEFN